MMVRQRGLLVGFVAALVAVAAAEAAVSTAAEAAVSTASLTVSATVLPACGHSACPAIPRVVRFQAGGPPVALRGGEHLPVLTITY